MSELLVSGVGEAFGGVGAADADHVDGLRECEVWSAGQLIFQGLEVSERLRMKAMETGAETGKGFNQMRCEACRIEGKGVFMGRPVGTPVGLVCGDHIEHLHYELSVLIDFESQGHDEGMGHDEYLNGFGGQHFLIEG